VCASLPWGWWWSFLLAPQTTAVRTRYSLSMALFFIPGTKRREPEYLWAHKSLNTKGCRLRCEQYQASLSTAADLILESSLRRQHRTILGRGLSSVFLYSLCRLHHLSKYFTGRTVNWTVSTGKTLLLVAGTECWLTAPPLLPNRPTCGSY